MILYGKCFVKQLYGEAVTETAGMPKQKKDLVHKISSNTTSAPTCINSKSVPYPHQPVLSYQINTGIPLIQKEETCKERHASF